MIYENQLKNGKIKWRWSIRKVYYYRTMDFEWNIRIQNRRMPREHMHKHIQICWTLKIHSSLFRTNDNKIFTCFHTFTTALLDDEKIHSTWYVAWWVKWMDGNGKVHLNRHHSVVFVVVVVSCNHFWRGGVGDGSILYVRIRIRITTHLFHHWNNPLN